MSQMTKTLSKAIRTGLFVALAAALSTLAQAAHHEKAEAEVKTGARAMALQAEAVVTAIDLETRQVSLEGPDGDVFTINATENVVKLEDVNIGDRLVVTYLAALESELRAPTAEELAEPWVVMEQAGSLGDMFSAQAFLCGRRIGCGAKEHLGRHAVAISWPAKCLECFTHHYLRATGFIAFRVIKKINTGIETAAKHALSRFRVKLFVKCYPGTKGKF